MYRYSTILFDLDGTLTDSGPGIVRSVQYALTRFGIKEPNLERLKPFVGPPLQDSFQRLYQFSAEEAEAAVSAYREYFIERGMFENEVYEGIPELLRSLANDSKSLIVATSKPTIFAKQILEHFHLAGHFDAIVGSNLDGTRSNKADIIGHVLRQYAHIPRSDVVMIGDREHDIIGGNTNDIASIGVTYGYGSREELERVSATCVVESVAALGQVLNPGQ